MAQVYIWFTCVEGLATALLLEPEAKLNEVIDHFTEIMEPINPFPSIIVTYSFTAISLQKEFKESKILAVKHGG